MIEVTVATIQISLVSQSRLVVLKERGSERYLPIWIGAYEADAIAVCLQGIRVPRPQTHDLMVNVLEGLGGKVRYIVVSNLAEETFYARLVLDVGGKEVVIDSRPSDAIALAVRAGAPIYVQEPVMEAAGIVPERNLLPGEPELLIGESDTDMGVFRDFLNSLNLDDLETND